MKDLLKDNSGIGRGNGILSASIGVQGWDFPFDSFLHLGDIMEANMGFAYED